MIERTCAFTGHRPKKFPWGYNEADARCIALKGALAAQIARLADAGYTDFLSGMAEGVDTWAALAVLDLQKENPALRLHCILPCEGQADRWPASARERYYSILERAGSVVYVGRAYRGDCMLRRNRYLVEHAACLLAVYNGERRGGTAATVRYARSLGRELLILDPRRGQVGRQASAALRPALPLRAAGEPGGDGAGGTDGGAAPAADALRAVDVPGDLHVHGTAAPALTAVHALAPVQAHLVEAEPVEQPVERPQGAQVSAKGPVDGYGSNQDRRQHQDLPLEQGPRHLPQGRVGD